MYYITAPATHSPIANRNVPDSQANTRSDDSGDNASRHAGLADQRPDVGSEQFTSNQPTGPVGRQESRSSLLSQPNEAEYPNAEKPMEVEPAQYEATDQSYPEGYENYDQNQTVAPEYQNQEYDQKYEQPAYTAEQYENYEQNQQYDGNYPQQYTDPNAQYEGQYENYSTDGNYQGEQPYDQSQETPVNQAMPSQENEPNERPEDVRTNSPNSKVPSQS
jgi:hypothetical protein